MMIVVALAVNATAMIVGMLTTLNPMMILMPVIWLMMFVSGTFVSITKMDGIGDWIPTGLIQNAAFDLTVFGRSGKCFEVITAGLIVFAAATLIGTLLFRRKGLAVK
jgi:ABC-2 type transport system permease protein